MEQEKKQVHQYTAEQYLMTAFSKAEWIPAEYKQLSGSCKDNPLALRELYLCACDKVSIEAVRMAISNQPIEENLKKVRNKHFENKYLDMHKFYVNELTETVDALRKEIGTVSSAAKKFTETIPSLEELFSNVPNGLDGYRIQELMDKKIQSVDEDVKIKTTHTLQEENIDTNVKLENKDSLSKRNNFFSSLFDKKIRPAEFLEHLYKENYSGEQINYIISCIEEGLSEKEIKTFISPKFDVDTMRRLRKLYVKEQ